MAPSLLTNSLLARQTVTVDAAAAAAADAAQSALHKITIAAWCGLSVLVWELITHAPQEYKMWKGRKTPAIVAFLIARWSGVMVLVMGLININGTGFNCQAVHVLVYLFYAFMSAAVSYVFCCRVLALYHMEKRIVIGMNAAFAGLVICWIATIAGLRAVPTGRSTAGSSCSNRDPQWYVLGWAASVAFDFVVLVATIVKIYNVKMRGEVLEYVRKSSIIYFISILACNTAILVMNWAAGSAGYARVIPIPVTCAFQVVVVSRLTFGLQGRGNGRAVATGGSGVMSSDVQSPTTRRGSMPMKGFGIRSQTSSQPGVRYQTTVVTTTSPVDGEGDISAPTTPHSMTGFQQQQKGLTGLGLPSLQHAFAAGVTWGHDPEKGES